MEHNGSKYSARRTPPPPPPTLGMGSICQTSTFLEHGHVAYPIEGNHEMQQYGSKYFAVRPLPNPTPTPHS